jgi:predicted nucleic acid-binding protein
LVVVDASAIAALLIKAPGAERIFERLAESDFDLHAPAHFEAEVFSALRRTANWNVESLEGYLLLPVTLHAARPFLARAYSLRLNMTPYDALYIALAEMLDVPLLTRDRLLSRAPGHRATLEVL